MGPCDMCGEQPQTMQIGNMNTGEQQFVCTTCFARFGLDFAKAILPPEEIASVLGPMFVDPAREDLHEGAARQRKARKSKAETSPDVVSEDQASAPDRGPEGRSSGEAAADA